MTADISSLPTIPPIAVDGAKNCEQALAQLRQQGADRLNPVDFHYLEAMARRVANQRPPVRLILERKLHTALAAYRAALDKAQYFDSREHATAAHSIPPAQGQLGPLGHLVQSTHAQTPAHVGAYMDVLGDVLGGVPSSAPTELKSVRDFRNTWSQLSAQKQVTQALGQAPKNAGPINSHMLVLRSLELMRDLSPDYLNRFISYTDTLVCLEQTELSAKPLQAKSKPQSSLKPKARVTARK